jgi:glycosyltransferase involved in cell wall biosynthesis
MPPNRAAVVVSVLIPTHDRKEFLAAAIESVLRNGFDALEIIVSDDSLTASALSVVEGFDNSRLRYVRGPLNEGKIANWNCACSHAEGEYLFKLDDDDVILPGFISACVSFLDCNSNVASVYPAYEIVNDDLRTRQPIIDTDFFGSRHVVPGADYILGVLANEGGYPRNHKTTPFFRRDVAQRIGFYADAREDFAFGVALATQGDVGYIPTIFYQYRIHAQGQTISDLYSLWKGSSLALRRLATSSAIQPPPALRDRWPNVLTHARQVLPLFYLQASLRQEGRVAAWSLWRRMRADLSREEPLSWRTNVLFMVGSLLPPVAHRQMLSWYQGNRWLQGLAKALV